MYIFVITVLLIYLQKIKIVRTHLTPTCAVLVDDGHFVAHSRHFCLTLVFCEIFRVGPFLN